VAVPDTHTQHTITHPHTQLHPHMLTNKNK